MVFSVARRTGRVWFRVSRAPSAVFAVETVRWHAEEMQASLVGLMCILPPSWQ